MARKSKRVTGPERFVPLKPASLEILMVLAEQPLHGYGILQSVQERSGGRIRLETGPLYRRLRQLLDAGLVVETEEPADAVGSDDRRRYYDLTSLGKEVLALEATRLSELVSRGRRLGVLGT